ncbi:MAG TPA: AMP-binding protein [Streptosporangiaceae bacterium]|nr:AMP-binding protein [Streptosporangiaceae bacterium]
MLTHASCFWANLSLDRTAEISGGDVVLQVLPQCHVGGWNVRPLPAWRKGATVVLEQSSDAGRVPARTRGKKVTAMVGVPASHQMPAAHPDFAAADLSGLRPVTAGGVPMPRPLPGAWLARGVTVMRGYDLTEAALAAGWPAAGDIAEREAGFLPHPRPRQGHVHPRRGERVPGRGRGGAGRVQGAAHFRAVPGLPKLAGGKLDGVTLGSVLADLAHGGGDAG